MLLQKPADMLAGRHTDGAADRARSILGVFIASRLLEPDWKFQGQIHPERIPNVFAH